MHGTTIFVIPDFTKTIIVQGDASRYDIDVVLVQEGTRVSFKIC